MSRPKKTHEDRRTEVFSKMYKIGKAKTGFLDPDICRAFGISGPTLREKKKFPGDRISIAQLETFGEMFGWSDADYLAVLRPEK